ncbi:2-oxoadipate dehydrogenase complex component E1-like [Ornithodoros turicata]|uniref:2-oxoadipate dehydrogenase complex component E1-like n=1 Tax=Ornithodoros turicata TaxID=34597 RepID=UPI003139DFCE
MHCFSCGRTYVISRRFFKWKPPRRRCSNETYPNYLVQNLSEESPKVSSLINAYRTWGHQVATINPLVRTLPMKHVRALDPESHGLKPTQKFSGVSVEELVSHLKDAYCGPVGLEFMYMADDAKKTWFARRYESLLAEGRPPPEMRRKFAEVLLKSQAFDNFLAAKFSTVKRYGGEGAESMMAFFYELFRCLPQSNVTDVVIGMPHRGRLNLLTGLLQFPVVEVLQKMKGMPEVPAGIKGSGDVLSHLATAVDLTEYGRQIHVTLLPNPSHLEAVSPVAVGKARARLQSLDPSGYHDKWVRRRADGSGGGPVLPIQVHGDASFEAQGVIMETLALARLNNFTVGGSLHLVVNNQIGFTTPPDFGRSSTYVSDIMKMIDAPVIHVNGDNPEAVAQSARLALEYRETFGEDILIDMVCFRRWGHNEMDDPTFTNPLMYDVIHARDSVPNTYAKELVEEGTLEKSEWDKTVSDYMEFLNSHNKQVDSYVTKFKFLEGRWKGLSQAPSAITSWDTGVPVDLLKYIGMKSVEVPPEITIHPHLQKVLVQDRQKKIEAGTNLDWATAEALAIGSLLYQGYNVRISGQDVGRGTFSQRHAMLVDRANEERYVPLNNMVPQQGLYEVVNSPLSEEAVMSFDYGMSLETPETMVIWEAQFGDFHNSAQVVIDTFVTSGETKWFLQSGMVILLPHGFDGAGPEHSSCRIERFLQMTDSKEDGVDGDDVNFHFVNPTTPAQYFHLLRRQMVRNFRKPLVVASPKIILRLPAATSPLDDLRPGTTFHPVLGDPLWTGGDCSTVSKVLLCSGKHYYALAKQREALQKQKEIAIVRLEALCPFPTKELSEELGKFKACKDWVWCQEEHQNMGPWFFVRPRLENLVGKRVRYAGRGHLGTPAVGIGQVHQKEVQQILDRAFS